MVLVGVVRLPVVGRRQRTLRVNKMRGMVPRSNFVSKTVQVSAHRPVDTAWRNARYGDQARAIGCSQDRVDLGHGNAVIDAGVGGVGGAGDVGGVLAITLGLLIRGLDTNVLD